MIIETFEAGPVATNGYLVADKTGGTALVIDAPQGTSALIVEQARKWNTPIARLVSTHGHWDHILDNAELLRLTGAKFGIHRESAPLLTLPQARYFGLDLDIEPSQPDFFWRRANRWTLAICGLRRFIVPVIVRVAWCCLSGRNAWFLWETYCSRDRWGEWIFPAATTKR